VKSKKILITGGAGYVGSHTVHYLISKGIKPIDIIVFDNLCYGNERFLPSGIIFIKGDLLNKEEIGAAFANHQIDSVIHFAAYAYVGESMQNPGKYFENNIMAGLNLLEAMQTNGCKKIAFSSTCATYGTPKISPISEDQQLNPINPYGESKVMFEKILLWYYKIYKIKSVQLRYFNAAGAGFGIGELHDPETHLIPLVMQAAKGEKSSVSLFGTDYNTKDGTCIRDYTHVIDLARAHSLSLELLDNDDFEVDSFNLGTGVGVSVREILDIAKSITGKNFTVIEKGRRKGDPEELLANPEKARKILKWSAEHDIYSIMNSAWEWEASSKIYKK
jgi:UDP-glucose 4-epimerase